MAPITMNPSWRNLKRVIYSWSMSLAKRIEAIIVMQERAALVDWPRTESGKIEMTGPITRNIVPRIQSLLTQIDLESDSF